MPDGLRIAATRKPAVTRMARRCARARGRLADRRDCGSRLSRFARCPAAVAAADDRVGATRERRSRPTCPAIPSARWPKSRRSSPAPTAIAADRSADCCALHGQALVASGQIARGAGARRPSRGRSARERPTALGLATALLVRSTVQWSIGDAGTANALAPQARTTLLRDRRCRISRHWALLPIGTTARARGHRDEVAWRAARGAGAGRARRQRLPPLGGALPAVDAAPRPEAGDPRARGEPRSMESSREAAGSAYAMVKAQDGRIGGAASCSSGPSASSRRWRKRSRSRASRSRASRSRVRSSTCRHRAAAHRLPRGARPRAAVARSRRASPERHAGSTSTSKANMGFALFGLGARAAKASGSPTRRSRTTSAPAPPPRSPACSANTASTSRRPATTRRARALPPRAQAQRRDRAAAHERVGARAPGEVRVRQAPARDRAPEPRERPEVGGARERGSCSERVWWLLAAIVRDLARRRRRLYRKLRDDQPPARARRTAS